MAEMANNSQTFNKISNDMAKGGKNFQMHGFINIQIIDLYDLAKGCLLELVNLSEICPGGG